MAREAAGQKARIPDGYLGRLRSSDLRHRKKNDGARREDSVRSHVALLKRNVQNRWRRAHPVAAPSWDGLVPAGRVRLMR